MTPEDLAKFKPGKVRLTIECSFSSTRLEGDTHVSLSFENSSSTFSVPFADIVSIERVRPELPMGWTWDRMLHEDVDCAIYTDGRGVIVVTVWMCNGDVSVRMDDLKECSVPLTVIEAVRNA